MFREPEPLTGKPTSPLMSALRAIFQYDEAFALQQIIANKRAFPLFIYKAELDKLVLPTQNWMRPAGDKTTMPIGNGYATDPSGDLYNAGLAPVSQEFLNEWNVRESLRRMSVSLQERAKQNDDLSLQMFHLPSKNRDTLEEFVSKGTQNPTLPHKLLAPGMTLESNVPEAKSLENFEILEEVLKIQICTLLGVPVEFIFGGGRFASDIALNRKIMETRTTRLHSWLGEVLSEIFLDIHFVDVYTKVDALSKELGDIDALKMEGSVDRDTFMTAGIMLKNKYKVLLEQDLLVSVHFAETTSASEESLLRALQTGVIDLEKYQQLMLATLGIPQSAKAKLTIDKAKELEKHVRGLDEPKPGTAGAGMKPKSTAAPKAKTDKARPAGERKKPAKKPKTSEAELRSAEKKQTKSANK
jgi:hypothetical protein